MHLRPELVLLQKTMVQVEGVARALDPKHDMWSAARPIVERWVKRELGPEAVTRRAVDEAGVAFAAMRRLPHTLTALEAAARKVSAEAPREERRWYQTPVFWLGMLTGGVLALILTASNGDRAPRQAPPTRAIETPAQPDASPRPSVDPGADLVTPPAAGEPSP
jgi:ubiquinone biosynthesis protein